MTFDRSEFREFSDEIRNRRTREMRPQLEMLAQAQVKADLLTGDSHWDTFLGYLEAAKQRTQDQLDELDRTLRSPELVNPDRVAGIRMSMIQLEERVRILDAVIALPADIRRSGEKAKNLLERLSE